LRHLYITVEFTSIDLVTSLHNETPDDDDAYSSKHVEV